ncbi:M56 family metallopeptidase [Streptomyces armeniacus]|uniref:M56 family metallopeptidase n=1 Tax=Streptomyces armeniacus TaxID=83291 RepID=UPI001AD7F0E1|nr:M56 family metallopeptidase [Streptomyces armeniacus]
MRTRRRPLLGNRAFWTLVATAAAVRAAIAVSSCCVVVLLAQRAAGHGAAALWSGTPSPLPATAAVAVTAVGLLVGAVTAVRLARASLAFRRHVSAMRTQGPAAARDASSRLRMAGRVTVVRDQRPFALTYGLIRPRVLISCGLLEILDPVELDAVLAHEREHVRSRDPLKAALVRVLVGRYFFLPLFRHLGERYTDGRELAADRRAVAAYGVPAVAGALLKVVETPRWASATPAAAMGAAGLLDARIGQLETGDAAPVRSLGFFRLSASIAGAVVLTWALAGTAVLMASSSPVGCVLMAG